MWHGILKPSNKEVCFMKALMQLMPFDKAKEVARRNDHAVKPSSICGIKREDIPWGSEIVVTSNNFGDRYYQFDNYVIPSCCFEVRRF